MNSALALVGYQEKSLTKDRILSLRSALPESFSRKIESDFVWSHGRSWLDGVKYLDGIFSGVVNGWKTTLDDDEIKSRAKLRSEACFRCLVATRSIDLRVSMMSDIVRREGLEPPDEKHSKSGRIARMCCAVWWRRQLRQNRARGLESIASKIGMVSKKAGLYVSGECLSYRRKQKRRNASILSMVEASNDLGQKFTLGDIAARGVANPVNRRNELMVRLSGFQDVASQRGDVADFVTLTAPSVYHSRSISGAKNKKHNGATPRDTQAYLCRVWARVRAALARSGVSIYGFRIAEPHHDGTPHWHMILFFAASDRDLFRGTLRRYALAEDGDEAGAAMHRCKFVEISPQLGGAVAYVSKYISKNVDGYGVGVETDESGGSIEAAASAERVDAWSSVWGIRQFQQIGGAPVGVWRELRRLGRDDVVNDDMVTRLYEAADRGDWAAYINLQGGAVVSRRNLTATVWRVTGVNTGSGELSMSRYGDAVAGAINGVIVFGRGVVTRFREWFFRVVPRSGCDWSRWVAAG